jgi:putative ABC transport system permease protein
VLSHRLRGRPRWRWAMAAIGGTGEGAGAVVLSLGLGLSVLAAVGQIDGNLRQAIAGNLPDVAPSYFFVDIQKDQMPGYTERLQNDPAVSRIDSAPMLRGVVTKINGRPAAETGGDHWALRGDRGLTYAAQPSETAIITKGQWWEADYTGPPQISVATEEAEEIGLNLGDTLTVNVLGRDITGTITSFQEVDFSNAGIGFVFTMNPAALEGAPHTFISTVYAEPEAEAQILRDLAKQFPNITAIRVKDALARVADVLGGLAAATSYGAGATLLTGFLVLIGAAAAGADARTYEAAMLKTMGASRRMIAGSFILRAALLGFAAGAVALLAGALGGWAVSTFVMETDYSIIWPSALMIIIGGIAATVLAGLGFARRALQARPARVLRARE